MCSLKILYCVFGVPVGVRMGLWDDMVVQWETIGLPDVVLFIYLLFLMVFVITSNSFYEDFVDSKPEGRKTAIG